MIVVDASVWVSSLLDKDQFFSSSVMWLENWTAAGHVIMAPVTLLSEVSGGIARRSGSRQKGSIALDTLLSNPFVRFFEIDQEIAESAALIAIDCQLRGADSIYVALASVHNVALATWDQEQLIRSKVVIESVRPPLIDNG